MRIYKFKVILVIIIIFLPSIFYSRYEVITLSKHSTDMAAATAMTASAPKPIPLKLMTYNIRHGVGMDNELNLDRIIQTINAVDPDIIALNEVDNMMLRSWMQKQDEIIAQSLGYQVAYGYNINFGAKYGNALLTKYPIKSWTNHELPSLTNKITEPRGLIEAELDVEGNSLKMFITHLSIITEERPQQVEFIINKIKQSQQSVILMGDLNERPFSEQIKKVSALLKDTVDTEYNTFPSSELEVRIDYILVSEDIDVINSQTIMSDASDHLPVVAEVVLK